MHITFFAYLRSTSACNSTSGFESQTFKTARERSCGLNKKDSGCFADKDQLSSMPSCIHACRQVCQHCFLLPMAKPSILDFLVHQPNQKANMNSVTCVYSLGYMKTYWWVFSRRVNIDLRPGIEIQCAFLLRVMLLYGLRCQGSSTYYTRFSQKLSSYLSNLFCNS